MRYIKNHFLDEATVCVKGKNKNGDILEVNGIAKNVVLSAGDDDEDDNFYLPRITDTRYFMKMEIEKFTLKRKPHEDGVEHTARIEVARYGEAEEPKRITPKMVAEATKRVGLPDDTPFHFEYKRNPATLEIVIYVEFSWTT